MWQVIETAQRYISHFGPREWLYSFIILVAFGTWCLRGFGSRANY